jgi:hypothetical protein
MSHVMGGFDPRPFVFGHPRARGANGETGPIAAGDRAFHIGLTRAEGLNLRQFMLSLYPGFNWQSAKYLAMPIFLFVTAPNTGFNASKAMIIASANIGKTFTPIDISLLMFFPLPFVRPLCKSPALKVDRAGFTTRFLGLGDRLTARSS